MGAKFTSLVSRDFPLYDDVHCWSPNAMLAARMRALEVLHAQAARRTIGAVSPGKTGEHKEEGETAASTQKFTSGVARPGVLSLDEGREESKGE